MIIALLTGPVLVLMALLAFVSFGLLVAGIVLFIVSFRNRIEKRKTFNASIVFLIAGSCTALLLVLVNKLIKHALEMTH